MIIFLYGPDTYRSRLKLKEIIDNYKKVHQSGLNLNYFDAKNFNFQDLKQQTQQSSMFKEKKLIVLTDSFSNPEFKKRFLKEGKIFINSENIILFHENNKVSKKDSLFVFLKKHAKSQEFKPLGERELRAWAKKQFKNLGAEISDKALDKLIVFVGNNLWQMINEVRKLASFRENQEIELNDVDLLVRPKTESNIFKTIDAIASRDKKKALQLLRAHLRKGDDAFLFVFNDYFQFRNLLIVKDLLEKNISPFTSSNLHPYVVKKSLALSAKFEFSELKKIYQTIFQVDQKIKTGKIEPKMALDLLITEI